MKPKRSRTRQRPTSVFLTQETYEPPNQLRLSLFAQPLVKGFAIIVFATAGPVVRVSHLEFVAELLANALQGS
jgi:hypothetical protein